MGKLKIELDDHKARVEVHNPFILRITTSFGNEISVELFERNPGEIVITCNDSLCCRPIASNRLSVWVDRSVK